MLEGRTAFVTGGAGAVGAAIARSLARSGASVAFSYLSGQDKAAQLEQELGKEGRRVKAYPLDVLDAGAATRLVETIEREAKKRLPGGVYEKQGYLTEEALAEIRKAVPELPQDKLVTGLRKTDLPSLLTVGFFVHLVARKLAAKEEGAFHA